jgi:predicted transcriptional regulator
VQEIVGKFDIKSILKNKPKAIWDTCKEKSSMNENDFFRYFDGAEKAYALEICNVKAFRPIKPSSIISNFSPPQSFRYVADINFET